MDGLDEAPLPWDGVDAPALMGLERLGGDRFRNYYNDPNIHAALYGGQILGQALAAAMATVEDRTVHSLHAYFLRAGSASERVTFDVERTRDGRRFSTRHVIARQGRAIFEMSCSFFQAQRGYEHQFSMPAAPPPEDLADLCEIGLSEDEQFPPALLTLATKHPIEIRPVSREALKGPGTAPRLQFWMRVPSASATDDPKVHQQLLAYLSDFWLAGAALVPHRAPIAGDDLSVASLDHAVWFHRPARVDEWLFYETESPSARNGVNFARGLIFDRNGNLIASATQEALQVTRD